MMSTDTFKCPTLSEDGWVSSPMKICDYLLSWFFLSDYSQSYIYHKSISSLPWILLETQKDINQTVTLTQQTLYLYFSRYFDKVLVEVSEVPNIEEPSKGQISIYIKFTDKNGKEHVVGKMLHIVDTTIEKIISIINS